MKNQDSNKMLSSDKFLMLGGAAVVTSLTSALGLGVNFIFNHSQVIESALTNTVLTGTTLGVISTIGFLLSSQKENQSIPSPIADNHFILNEKPQPIAMREKISQASSFSDNVLITQKPPVSFKTT